MGKFISEIYEYISGLTKCFFSWAFYGDEDRK